MADRTMVFPNKVQGPQFPSPLARQSSLYNLTFDEVQTQLGNVGKPLNCMNLDELLRNIIWVEEEGQIVPNPSSSSSSASFFLGNLNLNGTLSKKTVDEMWKDIVNEVDNRSMIQQKSTLGETTLEEFLVRAGVVNSRPIMGIDPMAVMVSQQTDSLQFQIAAVQQEQQHRSIQISIFLINQCTRTELWILVTPTTNWVYQCRCRQYHRRLQVLRWWLIGSADALMR